MTSPEAAAIPGHLRPGCLAQFVGGHAFPCQLSLGGLLAGRATAGKARDRSFVAHSPGATQSGASAYHQDRCTMKWTKLASLFLASALGLAAVDENATAWSGFLVDAKCYESMERNVNPFDPVNRDRGEEVLYCAPKPKTKVFSVVAPDGSSFKLDAAGDEKAADLVRDAGKRDHYRVGVTGEKNWGIFRVNSIVLAR